MFRVHISGEQETSKRCHLKGAYNLMVKDSTLCLCDLTSSHVLYEWPYNTIRRYGVTSHSFQFEAGRRSSSGEGVFAMDTNQSFQIFKAVEGIWKTPKESSALSGSVTCSDGCKRRPSADEAGIKDVKQRVVEAAESNHTYVNTIGTRQGCLHENKVICPGDTVGVYSEPYSIDTGTYFTAVPEKQQHSRAKPDDTRAGPASQSDVDHTYSEPYSTDTGTYLTAVPDK
ncbi:fibroblast growth factor receptor substrate 3-like [Haliotis cracherodii]|uniref:fibroblast growth factor receptor substrate 3-like n=1 Tax=Haliotis cracherodii TaxID=6455 RepID=UPI0039EBC6CF